MPTGTAGSTNRSLLGVLASTTKTDTMTFTIEAKKSLRWDSCIDIKAYSQNAISFSEMSEYYRTEKVYVIGPIDVDVYFRSHKNSLVW
eukprot:scaffold8300_cov171-Amphora_coffeaeformis.AAC.2